MLINFIFANRIIIIICNLFNNYQGGCDVTAANDNKINNRDHFLGEHHDHELINDQTVN